MGHLIIRRGGHDAPKRRKGAASAAAAVLLSGSVVAGAGQPASKEDGGGSVVLTEPIHTPVSRHSRPPAKAFALQQLIRAGYGSAAYRCLVQLWERESRWNPHARNTRTGAYGIPQRINGYGKPHMDDYRAQIVWGINYITGRYGSPCAALRHQQQRGWY